MRTYRVPTRRNISGSHKINKWTSGTQFLWKTHCFFKSSLISDLRTLPESKSSLYSISLYNHSHTICFGDYWQILNKLLSGAFDKTEWFLVLRKYQIIDNIYFVQKSGFSELIYINQNLCQSKYQLKLKSNWIVFSNRKVVNWNQSRFSYFANTVCLVLIVIVTPKSY